MRGAMAQRPLRLAEIVGAARRRAGGRPAVEVRRRGDARGAVPGDIAFLVQPKYLSELAATRGGRGDPRPEDQGDATALPRIVCRRPVRVLRARLAALQSPRADGTGHAPGRGRGARGEHRRERERRRGMRRRNGASLGERVVDRRRLRRRRAAPRSATTAACIRASSSTTAACVGARAIVHSGAVIGADGFGIAREGGQWIKIPQIGARAHRRRRRDRRQHHDRPRRARRHGDRGRREARQPDPDRPQRADRRAHRDRRLRRHRRQRRHRPALHDRRRGHDRRPHRDRRPRRSSPAARWSRSRSASPAPTPA